MARNGSGTYTVPNTFTSGTTITASAHNGNWSDVASEITNSVAVDGQSTMTGQLKAANGSVSAPSISFGSDTDSGVYRIGGDNIGVAVGGTKIVDISSTGVTVTGAVDATVVKQGTYRLIPAGFIGPYAGSSAPDGWLLCYGQAVSRTSYADLFSAIGTTYGAGDESTTFNLPDLRGRVVAGQDDMGGSSANRLTNQSGGLDGDTLGATGGAETHTLTLAHLPSESLTTTIPSGEGEHGHAGSSTNACVNGGVAAGSGGAVSAAGGGASVTIATGTLPEMTGTTDLNGSDTPHNNVQPTIILNYIVKY